MNGSGLKWEQVVLEAGSPWNNNIKMDTYRAKVPGGWLVLIVDQGVTFYPDPCHEWDVAVKNYYHSRP